MKPKSKADKTSTDHDQSAFEQLPEKTKELMKLKELEEKTTGPEQGVISRQIRDKASESQP
jgi:hypothetical protein